MLCCVFNLQNIQFLFDKIKHSGFIFKYLNNNFVYIIVNTLLIKRKHNYMHNIVVQLNVYKY